MGEIKGMMIAFVLFVAFFFPGTMMLFIDSLHQHEFMKQTTEVSELVKKEGGVTGAVQSKVSQLSGRGYSINFLSSGGQAVSGKLEYGQSVDILYSYTYQSVYEERTLTTQNEVFNMNR